jgi:microcystin-dependent protein
MPSSTNKGYTQPTYNSEVGTWGGDINANLTGIIDLNLGGQTNVALSSTNVTLTTGATGQMQNAIITLTGTLLANVIVYSSAVGFYFVENNTTGAFTVNWQANFGSGGVGTSYLVPQGNKALFVVDTANGARPVAQSQSGVPAGSLQAYAGSTAPAGWLLCYGQLVSTSVYAALYAVLGTAYGSGTGTFGLPDLRGRSIFGLDNMGGTPAGRLTGSNTGNISAPTTLGSTGGEENHIVLSAEMPSHTHTASVTDPSHSHTIPNINNFSPSGGGTGSFYNGASAAWSTNTATTGITVSNANTGGGGSHNTTPPAIVMNWLIKI